jgi:hypothetical protein
MLVKDNCFKVNDTELRAQLSQANTKESLASENEKEPNYSYKRPLARRI